MQKLLALDGEYVADRNGTNSAAPLSNSLSIKETMLDE
jgi:hypothetical protein